MTFASAVRSTRLPSRASDGPRLASPLSPSAQTALWCAPEVATSDHKPVACFLELERAQFRPRWLPRIKKNVQTGQTRKSVSGATVVGCAAAAALRARRRAPRFRC